MVCRNALGVLADSRIYVRIDRLFQSRYKIIQSSNISSAFLTIDLFSLKASSRVSEILDFMYNGNSLFLLLVIRFSLLMRCKPSEKGSHSFA